MVDTSIIMSARGPDIFGAAQRGRDAGQLQLERQRQNALASYVQQNGAGIMQGDQNALAGYAAYDPQGAMQLQGQQQNLAFNAEEMAYKREDRARATAEALAAKQGQIDAAQLEREGANLESTLRGAYPIYERGDPNEFAAYVSSKGLDPTEYTLENFPSKANEVEGVLDGIKMSLEVFKSNSGGAEWADLSKEEAAAAGFSFAQRNVKTGLVKGTKAGGGVTVNTGDVGAGMGTIPQGYSAVPDQSNPSGYTMYPIPGGPEDMTGKNAVAAGNAQRSTDVIVSAASRAREAAGSRTFGGLIGKMQSYNPATQNAEVYRQIEVLGAAAVIDNLQAMRDASPTGGALGAVTAPELQMLKVKSGALDPASPNFQRDLDDYERTLLWTVHGPEAGDAIYAQTRKGAGTPVSQSTARPRAQNPETGETVEWDGTAWVTAQ